MIHHIDFAVADIERSRLWVERRQTMPILANVLIAARGDRMEFYVRALAPLGLTMLMEFTLPMVAALARAMRHCSRLVHGV